MKKEFLFSLSNLGPMRPKESVPALLTLTEVYVCPHCLTVARTASRCYDNCDRDHGTERVRFVRAS